MTSAALCVPKIFTTVRSDFQPATNVSDTNFRDQQVDKKAEISVSLYSLNYYFCTFKF